MHRILYIITLAIVIPGLAGSLQAQNQKIGYIDSDYILSHMPEYEGIEQRLTGVTQAWKEELDEMQNEIDRLKEDFEAREILYTEEVRIQRKEEIDQKIRQREQFLDSHFGPDGEYFSQQQELLEPLQQRILEATNEIADRDGFDFIFDRAGDYIFMYTRQSWNLSDDILLEMGIHVDDF